MGDNFTENDYARVKLWFTRAFRNMKGMTDKDIDTLWKIHHHYYGSDGDETHQWEDA